MSGRSTTHCRKHHEQAGPPLAQNTSPAGASRRSAPGTDVAVGGIYGTVLSFNIDAPWLLRLHTGNFGVINLQPIYSPLLAIMTLVLVISGLSLLQSGRVRPSPEKQL